MKQFKVWTGEDMITTGDISITLDGKIKVFGVIHEEYKILQSLNRKDKNGVDLWEGDIVELHEVDIASDEYHHYINNDDTLITFEDIPHVLARKDVVTLDRFPVFWLKNERFGYEGEELVSTNDVIKVGNIYENLEFLEGK